MEINSNHLDESLLATANAWMRKAAEDRLDGQILSLNIDVTLVLEASLKAAKTS